MPQLLTLTRAARLIGVQRGALQKKIRDGELETFEGMVDAEDLLRLYPKTSIPSDTALARLDKIKDDAYSQRVRERALPSAEILWARLNRIAHEQETTKALLDQYRRIFDELGKRLENPGNGSVGDRSITDSLAQWLRMELAKCASTTESPRTLSLEDSFLRIIAAHVYIDPSRHEFFVDGNDDILNAAMRSGLALHYGCRDGHCGLCKARILSGQIKPIRPTNYKFSDEERELGYALLCCNTAITDLQVEVSETALPQDIPQQQINTVVKTRALLTPDMMLLQLQMPPSERIRFLAGQSLSLQHVLGGAVTVPVASCPCDESTLEFHLARPTTDGFVRYAFEHLAVADKVKVTGPLGNFVLKPNSPNPIIFIAIDIGFAPIKSLVEHAMALGVAESVHLYWLVHEGGKHYMHNLCRAWSDALDNFRYTPLTAILEHHPSGRILPSHIRRQEDRLRGLIDQLRSDHPDLAEFDVYAAGPALAAIAIRNLMAAEGLPKAQLAVESIGPENA